MDEAMGARGALRQLGEFGMQVLRSRAGALLLGTGVMLIILAFKEPSYVTLDNLKIVGLQTSEVGIVAVGGALLIVAGNVDLSVGSMTGLIAVASALLSLTMPEPWPLIVGVAIGGACGLFNGYLVWRVKLSPIIITIGSLSLFYGIALVLNHGVPVDNAPPSFAKFGSVNVFGFSLAFVAFVALTVVVGLYLSMTQGGRHLYAIGGNPEAATRVGIPAKRLIIIAFVVNGLITGLGAILLASRFSDGDPTFGVNLEIQVITAVILGGVAFTGGEGDMAGVFMAVIFLSVLETGIVAVGVSPYWSDVVEGGALILAVALQQLAKEQRERRQRAAALADLAAGGPPTSEPPSMRGASSGVRVGSAGSTDGS